MASVIHSYHREVIVEPRIRLLRAVIPGCLFGYMAHAGGDYHTPDSWTKAFWTYVGVLICRVYVIKPVPCVGSCQWCMMSIVVFALGYLIMPGLDDFPVPASTSMPWKLL